MVDLSRFILALRRAFTSPKLGVIPKKHQTGKWWLNDFIDPSLCSLTYASVDDAADFVLRSGRGTLLAKLYIKSAYRNIPVHPGDCHVHGIRWRGRTLVDACLPFGLCSATKIFNATADALEWMITHQGGAHIDFVIHSLDVFLFGGSPGTDSCAEALGAALQIIKDLGFLIMSEKVVGATEQIDFLGFVLDTEALEIRLSQEKLWRIRPTLHSWRDRGSCSKRKLLSRIGTLQHASAVVKTWSYIF